MMFHTRNRELEMARSQNQMASQTRIQELRDDPIAAAHSSRLQSYDARLERFHKNSLTAMDRHRHTEGQLYQGVEVMQRIRELAVQGAHGTYSPEDMKLMAVEVDELLQEMLSIANARDGKGKAVFGGGRSDNLPFLASMGNVPGAGREMISEVRYTGDITRNLAEVSEGVYMPLNFPGNEVFWAENQQVYSSVDASAFTVQQDSSISIQGKEIQLQEGDSVFAVMAKINASGVGVRARMDPVDNSLVMETTSPQQLWIQDNGTGTVLQDLGITAGGTERPPHNIAATAQVFGGSAFDMIIQLRDRLMEGRPFEIGGDGLRGVDQAMESMLTELGKLGAQHARLEKGLDTLSYNRLVTGERNSRFVDLDMAEAITELKRLESTHKAALSVSARIMQTTLLDFIR
ncbi:flagellar hook-associated protein 3 [Spirochaeta dissipatitropha]